MTRLYKRAAYVCQRPWRAFFHEAPEKPKCRRFFPASGPNNWPQSKRPQKATKAFVNLYFGKQ